MHGVIDGLYNYPIKGFTPQALQTADLSAGQAFPGDRLYAVEDGPSGFDPAAPVFIRKQSFTVLAKIAKMAQVRSRFDLATGRLLAEAPGAAKFAGDLTGGAGKAAFAAWLSGFLGVTASGPLKVIDGQGHRFTDHPQGHISLINLASLRDLETKIGLPVDPMRFRGNLYVEGLPAWVEDTWVDKGLCLGVAKARVFSRIVRCAATQVDPATGISDLDIPTALHAHYGHVCCGVYLKIMADGALQIGDQVTDL